MAGLQPRVCESRTDLGRCKMLLLVDVGLAVVIELEDSLGSLVFLMVRKERS
jgi:hypothetical protein